MGFTVNRGDVRGSLFDFTGGLNDRAQNDHIKDNEASAILNMVFSTFGPVSTRLGYTKVNSVDMGGNGVFGLAQYKAYDGTKQFLSVADGKLFKLVGSTWTQVGTGFTADKYTSIINLQGVSYFANGVDDVKQYDGTTFASVAKPPANPCSYLLSIYNPPRVFAVRAKDYISRYYWSVAGTPGDFTSTGSGSEELPNGDELMGCGVAFGNPIMFGRETIWMIVGRTPATWELRQLNSSVGLAAPRSIAYVGGVLVFAALDGVYALSGVQGDTGSPNSFDAISARKISKNIQGTWDTINKDLLINACAGVLNNKYELSVTTLAGLHNNTTLYCDFQIDLPHSKDEDPHPWSVFDYGFNYFATYQTGNTPYLYGGDSTNGTVYQLRNGTNDIGTAINWYYKTKYFNCGVPEYNKEFDELFVWTTETGAWSVNFGYSLDGESGPSGLNSNSISLTSGGLGWGTMTWGVDEWRATVDVLINKRFFNTGDYGFTPAAGKELKKRGRTVRFSVAGSTLDQYMTLVGISVAGHITDKSIPL